MSIKINKRVGWRRIGEEVVSFNCENQKIVIWNEVASNLWERISRDNCTVKSLSSWLAKKYSISLEQSLKDIIIFVKEAEAMGFIHCFGDNKLESEISEENGENVLLAVEMKAIEKLIPFAVTFETTYNCNELCLHCYMERNLPSLSLTEIEKTLKDIADMGCLFVSFTGGEIFTRNDALKIIESATKLNFVVDILSNGILIDQDIARLLSDYLVRRVQVSIYGSNQNTHDSITRTSGSFTKTLKAIELLTENNVKVEVAFPLMSLNFHERYLVKNLVESMGCLISPNHLITARNDGSKDTFDLRLKDSQLKELINDKEFFGLYAGRKPFQDHQFYLGFSDILKASPCYSGFNSCAISPAGKVFPCNQLLYEVGDLKRNTFSEIWQNSPKLSYLRGLTLRDLKCANCEFLKICSRCPGLALLEGGDLLGPSPENCRVTRVQSKIF